MLEEETVNAILDYWETRRKIIDEKINEMLANDVEASMIDIAQYIVRGGKRFRGVLTLLSCESLGGTIDKALDAAMAIELVHAASLSLDDIIDGDLKRRGKLATWVVYGIPKTVLASNILIPLAQRIVSKYGFKALLYVIKAWEDVTRGEILDVYTDKARLRKEDYLDVIGLKTASLFRLAATLGVIASGREENIEVFSDYGYKLGLAYQLADDIVDLALYMRGEQQELTPMVKLMVEWVLGREVVTEVSEGLYMDIMHKSLKLLRDYAFEARRLVMSIDAEPYYQYILANIPYLMIQKMLEEADMRESVL